MSAALTLPLCDNRHYRERWFRGSGEASSSSLISMSFHLIQAYSMSEAALTGSINTKGFLFYRVEFRVSVDGSSTNVMSSRLCCE